MSTLRKDNRWCLPLASRHLPTRRTQPSASTSDQVNDTGIEILQCRPIE